MPSPATGMPRRPLYKRAVGRISRNIKAMCGVPSFLRNEDRRVLEQVIFPYFLQSETCNDVLFVGCDWYTEGYNRWFEVAKNYWTVDVDPSSSKYGAVQHVVDGVQNIDRHFRPDAFDLILCNGVFGWGLNAKADVEQAFLACHRCLRDDGVLVVGWDAVDERCPFSLGDCASLRQFSPFTFAPLGMSEYQTDTPYRHTYTFFVKPKNARGPTWTGASPTTE